MSDRRKQIEEAAVPYAVVADVRPTWPDLAQAFIAGAEWADANNAEIPPLKLLLADTVIELREYWIREVQSGDVKQAAKLWELFKRAEAALASSKAPASTPTPRGEK